MADQLTVKELDELRKLVNELRTGTDFDLFLASKQSAGALVKELTQLRKEYAGLNSDITYLVGHLKDATREVSNQTNAIKDTRKAYNSLSSIASKLKYDQDGISRLNKKDLESIFNKWRI